MKKVLSYVLMLAATLLVFSCKMDKFEELEANNNGTVESIKLTFKSASLQTKASPAGVGYENAINRIDYFLFENGAAEDVASKYYGSIVAAEDGHLEDSYSAEITDATKINAIFNGGSTAKVFAVANYPDESVFSEGMTIAQIKALPIEDTFTDFDETADPEDDQWVHVLPTTDANLFFVMTGEGTVEKDSEALDPDEPTEFGASGTIDLERVADKVTVKMVISNSVTSGGLTWRPITDRANRGRIDMTNGVNTASVGGAVENARILGFDYNYLNTENPQTTEGTTIIESPIFYTYPVEWEDGDMNQPFLKIILPWHAWKDGKMIKQKEFYYKIPFPASLKEEGGTVYTLGSNIWYQLTVNVDVLGGEDPSSVELWPSYHIVDWTTSEPVGSNLGMGRYISLEIPQDEYNMYTELVEIGFVASGEVAKTVEEIYQMNYSGATPTHDVFMEDDVVTTNTSLLNRKHVSASDVEGWVTVEGTKLIVNHKMNTDLSDAGVDVGAYVYRVRLHLKAAEDDSFDRVVTITQYPPIYVETKNGDNAFVNGWYGHVDKAGTGTFYYHHSSSVHDGIGVQSANDPRDTPYGEVGTTTSQNGWYSYYGTMVRYLGNNGSGLPYSSTTLLVSIGALSGEQYTEPSGTAKKTYMIADPRVESGYHAETLADYLNATAYNGTTTKAWTETEASSIKIAGPTDNFIAPKFLISSAWGRQGNNGATLNNYIDAEYRCATYQEAGYPAGRWRLPTEAEVNFIANLQSKGLITPVFTGGGNNYVSNHRLINVSNNNVVSYPANPGGRTCRCIYDAWYWGEEPDAPVNTYTIGSTGKISSGTGN